MRRSRRSAVSSAPVTSASRFTRTTVSTDTPVRSATSLCECPARSRTWISWRLSSGSISAACTGLRAISADPIMCRLPCGRPQIFRNRRPQIFRNHHPTPSTGCQPSLSRTRGHRIHGATARSQDRGPCDQESAAYLGRAAVLEADDDRTRRGARVTSESRVGRVSLAWRAHPRSRRRNEPRFAATRACFRRRARSGTPWLAPSTRAETQRLASRPALTSNREVGWPRRSHREDRPIGSLSGVTLADAPRRRR